MDKVQSSFLPPLWNQMASSANTTYQPPADLPQAIEYPTLRSYLASLPTWYRRLLHHFEQLTTDLTIWRAFRSRRRLIIATDGSLLPSAGTFGWKLTTEKHAPLYHGSGPIDGPIDIGSCTRSELGGFTAPLLLITLLARHWGLRHRCKFRWLVDSKIAIQRVTFTVSKDHRSNTQPDNLDYLSVIKDLHRELRRPLKIQWIKGHQDNQTEYAKLPADTKLNIDVDKLATDFHQRPRSKPAPTTAHIPLTRISVTINNVRYASKIEANLRYQINGGYLRNYLQNAHKWSNSTWEMINLPAFGRHLKSLPLPHHTAHLKFIHNKQPLGITLLRHATIKDPAIALCPCCEAHPENQHHLIHCQHNSSRSSSIDKLLTSLTKLDNQHPYGLCIANCIEQHLTNPSIAIDIPLAHFPARYHEVIYDSIREQTHIGWHHLLHGFLSLSWLRLASFNQLSEEKPDIKRGHHRTQKTLQALHEFTRAMWLGRNDALHKTQDTVTAIRYSAESTEIRHYHADPLLLPAEDRHYCSHNLGQLLRSRPSVRRRWLLRVRTARSNMLKHGSSQSNITKFFKKTTSDRTATARTSDTNTGNDTAPPRAGTSTAALHIITTQQQPPPRIERTPGRPPDTAIVTTTQKRNITTQQRMTAFFPGRPPDHSTRPTTPGNPSHV